MGAGMDWEKIEKFTGDGKMHPMIFLKNIEEMVKNNRRRYGEAYTRYEEVNMIRGLMRGDAQLWYETMEEKIGRYEEFKEIFRQQYWGELEQEKIKREVQVGRYNKSMGTREKYLIQKYALYKHLDNIVEEAVIIGQLAGHFGEEIKERVIKDNVRTYNELKNILKRFDLVDEEKGASMSRGARDEEYGRTGNRNGNQGGNRYGDENKREELQRYNRNRGFNYGTWQRNDYIKEQRENRDFNRRENEFQNRGNRFDRNEGRHDIGEREQTNRQIHNVNVQNNGREQISGVKSIRDEDRIETVKVDVHVPYEEPYVINRRFGDTYELRIKDSERIRGKFHLDRMYQYDDRDDNREL
ncbi:hypothetical protein RI129_001273 [Pyrocoelia pectoralis]|uniref:Uncharacterized protein n=1 Tax=Pyrocoelia pectoralis TaxID=417401 RepID=A0AAN7VTW7_9COLE